MLSQLRPANVTIKMMRRFGRHQRGSAAIEFAIVGPLFFALLFAILETALVFFASQTLETAVQDSARKIMTGQAKAFSQADFKTEVCGRISALFDCAGGIYIDVQSFKSTFANVVIADPIDADRNFVNNMKYDPGKAGDIVVVRLFYQWPLFLTGLGEKIGFGYNISNLSGNKRLLSATAAFRNEPWS